jgi:hypothetical protein
MRTGTQNRRFRTRPKYERAAIARRQSQQLFFRRSQAELLGSPHNFLQGLKPFALLGDE